MTITPDVLGAAIERALAPYAGRFSPALLDTMRREMREYAASHPYPIALLRQLEPASVVRESGTRTKRLDGSAGDGGLPGLTRRRANGDSR